jgi:succinyl-CoA synthetase beta subunit
MLHAGDWVVPDSTLPAGPTLPLHEIPTGALDEEQAKRLFAAFGIPGAGEIVVSTPEEAASAARKLGDRVVLKVLSSEILHKSDVGGVAVGLSSAQIGQRLVDMKNAVRVATGSMPARFLVQEMVAGGTEVMIGMHRDALGTGILLGMGGVTAELFKDTTMRLLPPVGGLSESEALAMAQELKTWPLLDGYRGRVQSDVGALVRAIVAFSQMVAALGDRLLEAEINPLFVLPKGEGVRAADGLAVLGQ